MRLGVSTATAPLVTRRPSVCARNPSPIRLNEAHGQPGPEGARPLDRGPGGPRRGQEHPGCAATARYVARATCGAGRTGCWRGWPSRASRRSTARARRALWRRRTYVRHCRGAGRNGGVHVRHGRRPCSRSPQPGIRPGPKVQADGPRACGNPNPHGGDGSKSGSDAGASGAGRGARRTRHPSRPCAQAAGHDGSTKAPGCRCQSIKRRNARRTRLVPRRAIKALERSLAIPWAIP